MHFLMYGGLAALLRWALKDSAAFERCRHFALTGAVGYGLLMEILQKFLTHGMRSFSWYDVLMNTIGAIVFWLLAGKLLRGIDPYGSHINKEESLDFPEA